MALLEAVVAAKLAVAKAILLGIGFTAALLYDTAKFSNTITLGALLITAAVGVGTIVSLVYGVRYRSINRVLASERDVYQERSERLEADMVDYREKKHEQIASLTGQMKATQAELELERGKHDLSTVVDSLGKVLERQAEAQTAVIEEIARAQKEGLSEIVKALRLSETRMIGAVAEFLDKAR